jgi:hypothetical protein
VIRVAARIVDELEGSVGTRRSASSRHAGRGLPTVPSGGSPRSYAGVGLGLAIYRHWSTPVGGSRAESEAGGGATIRFRLPCDGRGLRPPAGVARAVRASASVVVPHGTRLSGPRLSARSARCDPPPRGDRRDSAPRDGPAGGQASRPRPADGRASRRPPGSRAETRTGSSTPTAYLRPPRSRRS